MKKFIFSLLSLLGISLLIVASVAAQNTTGNLVGTVKDQNGAVVPGATVKATNTATGHTKEAVTNQDGYFRILSLEPGDSYKLEVTKTGFAAYTQTVSVRLGVDNAADVNLSVTAVGGVVTITADTPVLQTEQSQLSGSYSPKKLTELPATQGGIEGFALLEPGVVTPGDTDFTNGTGITANGNRGRSNNFQIDGQDNNDNSVAGPALNITNTEAIGEVQVITNTFSAEFGRNTGAQVNSITKSGSNEFHGSAFWYHQNSAMTASDNLDKKTQAEFKFMADNGQTAFNGLALRRNDPFRDNRYGGAIGGPIIKEKAFFFVTYEGEKQRGEFTGSGLGGGALTFTKASAQQAAAFFGTPAAQTLIATTPGGGPAFAQGVGNFIVAPPVVDTNGDGIADTFVYGPAAPFGDTPTATMLSEGIWYLNGGVQTKLLLGEPVRTTINNFDSDQLISRVDFNTSKKDNFNIRYIYDNDNFPVATGRFLAGALFDVPSYNHNLGVTWNRDFNASMVNQARFTFSRLYVSFGDTSNLPGTGISLSSTATQNFDLGLTYGTQNNLPQSRKVDTYQFQDTLRWFKGNHGFSFGADVRMQRVVNFFLPNFLGTTTFTGGNPFAGGNATAGTLPAGTPFIYNPDFTGGATVSRAGARPTAFENLLTGNLRQVSFARGNPEVTTSQNDFFFFVQDDWKVRSNLTLNLGLRYEISTTPFNPIIDKLNAREANAATALFDPAFPLADRTQTKLPLDKNNFGPRIGFAWSPSLKFMGGFFDRNRTVFRGSFGISYDPSFFNIVLNTVTAAPFAVAGTIVQTPGAVGSVTFPFNPTTIAQQNLTPGTNGGNPRLFNQTRVDPKFHNPYTVSFGFGIQQELWKDTVLEARYVGNLIKDQFQTKNGNPNVTMLNRAAQCLGLSDFGAFSNGVVFGTAAANAASACSLSGFSNTALGNGNGRVDSTTGLVRLRDNGAHGAYHGLQTRFDTRMGNDLVLGANFTWSKTIDNASEIFSTGGGGSTVAGAQKFFDTDAGELGLSAFHQKFSFVANFLYDTPWYRDQQGFVGKLLGGYRVGGVVRLGSGRSYSINNAFARYDNAFDGTFFGLGVLRPFNGNPSAGRGTLAVGCTTVNNILGAGSVACPTGSFAIYDTLKPGSQYTVVASGAAAVQAARFVYNDFGTASAFGVPLTTLEAFNFFRTPYGNVGRNTEIGAPLYLTNLSIFKTVRISEKYSVELRAEAFNAFNQRNFGVPDPVTEDVWNGFVVGSYQNPGFNNGGQRQWRFGLRFLF